MIALESCSNRTRERQLERPVGFIVERPSHIVSNAKTNPKIQCRAFIVKPKEVSHAKQMFLMRNKKLDMSNSGGSCACATNVRHGAQKVQHVE